LIQSELAGLAFDSAQSIFRPSDIDAMFDQEAFSNVVSEDIYIVIDPAGCSIINSNPEITKPEITKPEITKPEITKP
jgi:hypothetical protein